MSLSLLIVVAVGGALIVGVFASTGNPLYAGAFVGLAAGLWLLRNQALLLWTSIIGGLIIAGVTRLYFPAVQQVRWILTPLSLALIAHLAFYLFHTGTRGSRISIPSPIWWAVGFFIAILTTTLLNDIELNRFAVGMKGYFQIWGLLLAVALIPWRHSTIDALPRALLLIGILQVPFVLHQWIVLVPKRAGLGDGIIPVDIIAGTFGASLEGGGANAILAAFLVVVIAGLLSAAQHRTIPSWWLVPLVPMLLFPMMVNMAKVTVVYLLVAFGVLFWRDAILKPLRFLAGLITVAILGTILMTAFMLSAPENSGVEDWKSLVEFTYQSNIGEDEVAGRLTRASTLSYWLDHHWPSDVMGLLIGHGVGVTRVADLEDPTSSTVSVSRENVGVPILLDLEIKPGTTAVAAVLWEGGFISLFLLAGLFVSTYRSAGRLAAQYRDHPERAAALRAAQVAIAVFSITLLTKNNLVFDVVYQTLLFTIIGYVAFWDREQAANRLPLASRPIPRG